MTAADESQQLAPQASDLSGSAATVKKDPVAISPPSIVRAERLPTIYVVSGAILMSSLVAAAFMTWPRASAPRTVADDGVDRHLSGLIVVAYDIPI
jgi:hypothetical protein